MSDKIKISQLPLKGEFDGSERLPLSHDGVSYGATLESLQSYMGGSGGGLTEIEDGSITTAKLADDAVTIDKIADDAVDTSQLVDYSVTATKIANGAVNTSKLATSSVTAGKIAESSVITSKLRDAAVSEAKIASNAVTTDKLADEAVTEVKLSTNLVDKINNPATQLSVGSGLSVSGGTLNLSVGNGVSVADGSLSLNVGTGLFLDGGELRLGTNNSVIIGTSIGVNDANLVLGSGLGFVSDTRNKLMLNIGSGLKFSSSTDSTINSTAKIDLDLDYIAENISVSGGSGEVTIYGMINLTDIDAVTAAQSGLAVNEVRFFVITDNEGKIPSEQKCYDVPEDVARQLSMTTDSSIVNATLASAEVEPFGVSVGDLIGITKVSVSLADLSEYLGLSFSLSGNINIYQYKMMHTTVAREENFETACTKGVRGLLTPWEKTILNGSAKPTRWAWGYDLNQCLQSGVLAYTNATILGTTANWTIFVDCAATPDGGGYYHLTQTAIGRDTANLGSALMRFGYYKQGEAATFLDWKVLAE